MSDSEEEMILTGDEILQCAEDMQKVVDKIDALHEVKVFMECCRELVLAAQAAQALAGNQTHLLLNDTKLADGLAALVSEIEDSLSKEDVSPLIVSAIRAGEEDDLFRILTSNLQKISSTINKYNKSSVTSVDQNAVQDRLTHLASKLEEDTNDFVMFVDEVTKRARKASKKDSGQLPSSSSGQPRRGPVASQDLTDSPDEDDSDDRNHDSEEWQDEDRSDQSGQDDPPESAESESDSDDDMGLEEEIERQRREGIARGRKIRQETLRAIQQQSQAPPHVQYGQGNGYGPGPQQGLPRRKQKGGESRRDANGGSGAPPGPQSGVPPFGHGGPNAHMYPPPPPPPGQGHYGYPHYPPYGYNPYPSPPMDMNMINAGLQMLQAVPPGGVLNLGSGNMMGNNISNIGNNYARTSYNATPKRKKT